MAASSTAMVTNAGVREQLVQAMPRPICHERALVATRPLNPEAAQFVPRGNTQELKERLECLQTKVHTGIVPNITLKPAYDEEELNDQKAMFEMYKRSVSAATSLEEMAEVNQRVNEDVGGAPLGGSRGQQRGGAS